MEKCQGLPHATISLAQYETVRLAIVLTALLPSGLGATFKFDVIFDCSSASKRLMKESEFFTQEFEGT